MPETVIVNGKTMTGRVQMITGNAERRGPRQRWKGSWLIPCQIPSVFSQCLLKVSDTKHDQFQKYKQ